MASNSLTAEQRRRIEENKQKALAKRAEKLKQSPAKPINLPSPAAYIKPVVSGLGLNQQKRSIFQSSGPSVSTSSYGSSEKTKCSPVKEADWIGAVVGKKADSKPQATGYHGYSSVQNRFSSNSGLAAAAKPMAGSSFHGQKNVSSKFYSNTASTAGSGVSAQNSRTNATLGSSPVKKLMVGKAVKGTCVLVARERFEVNVGYSAPLIELFKTMNTKLYDAATKRWSFNLKEYNRFTKAVAELRPNVIVEPLPKAVLQAFSAQMKGDNPSLENPSADLSQIDSTIVDALLPFQREGVNFAIHRNGRVLIADDMGLGKTIQAICLACFYKSEWPVLVVTPSSVRFAWAQQIRRWVPSLDPQSISVAVTGKDSCTSASINIVSYDLMARKAAILKDAHFQLVIMDECHLLKNFKTARCKAALPILQNAKRVFLLSGTPALSRPSELYTQVTAVCPYIFKFHDFGVRYCDGKEGPWGWDYSGSSNMGELQLLLEEKIMIRRLKKDVLTELPAKRRQMVLLDPSSVKVHKDLKQASRVLDSGKLKGMQRRGALLDYFRETSKAKIPAIRDYVADLLEAEKKFLFFAHHQEVLDTVEDIVKSKLGNSGYMRIDGKTKAEQRNFYVRKFQESDQMLVALLSITAANAGLDLSAASMVIFGELFWNPGILVQAEDRAHRIGQQDCVNVHYLVAQATADDHIWPLVQKKLDVLNKAGLTKDDFSLADTTRFKDPKQREILEYFEESFFEDDMDEMDSMDTHESFEHPLPSSNDIGKIKKNEKESTEAKSGLFQYFEADSRTTHCTGSASADTNTVTSQKGKHKTEDKNQDIDILDDSFDWECDDDFDEPETKKPRI